MGILTNLNSGQKIRFEGGDIDLWGYNGSELQQYINGELTGYTLPVINVDENSITIDWGDIESTLPENWIEFVNS